MQVDDEIESEGNADQDAEWHDFLAEHTELISKAATGRRERTGRQRKLPWRDMSMVDGSPLRAVDSEDLDVDGDSFGLVYDDVIARASERVAGLTQFGHGFQVESVSRPADPVRCRYCEGLMPALKSAEWFCEFDVPFKRFASCECNFCLVRAQAESGLYRGKGRPRTQCGAKECNRQANADRKRKSRAKAAA